MAHAEHEDNDLASDADFCTDVEEEGDAGEDGDKVRALQHLIPPLLSARIALPPSRIVKVTIRY